METESPKRVHILGLPGSGKSTLARRIARSLCVEAVDLDVVARPVVDESLSGAERARERWDRSRAAAAGIAAEPVWVTEGIYCGWTAPLLAAADLVVWLDIPVPVAVFRIVRRHAARSLAGDNPHRGLRLLARFCWEVVRDPSRPAASDEDLMANVGANSRATTADRLGRVGAQGGAGTQGGAGDRVVHCRGNRDVDRVLAFFGISAATRGPRTWFSAR